MRIVGHRGASHTAPENTLASVRSALDDGHGFEVDLQLLRDGNLIVLHDDTLERTALHDPAKEYRAIVRAPITTLRLQDVEDIDVGSFFGEGLVCSSVHDRHVILSPIWLHIHWVCESQTELDSKQILESSVCKSRHLGVG